MYLLTTVLSLSLMCLATFAYPKALPREQANAVENDEWQNDWTGELHVECGPKDAVIWIHSEYSDKYGDRRWRFDCDRVIGGLEDECVWHGPINDLAQDFEFECPPNQYMAGVQSSFFLSPFGSDRIWNVKCCRKNDVCTTEKAWSNFINEFEGPIAWQGLSTGLSSIYGTFHSDRRWKVLEAAMVPCED